MTTVEEKGPVVAAGALSREGRRSWRTPQQIFFTPGAIPCLTGVRFRTKDDQADDEALDEANVAAEQGDK